MAPAPVFLIAGGTGLVGRALVRSLSAAEARSVVLTRTPRRTDLPPAAEAVPWQDLDAAMAAVDVVVNLAGEGIADRRWTEARKEAILRSRLEATERLVAAMSGGRPRVLVNASAVGYYGLGRGEVDETSPRGLGFLAEVCSAWEASADRAPGRVVKLRLGAVLAREGGALPAMVRPIRWGFGAVLGDGHQGFPWIHVEDAVAMILEAASNPAWSGPVNAVAPQPSRMGGFTRALARHLHRPLWPVPAWLSRAALGFALGELAGELLLEGPVVHPLRGQQLGFAWRFPGVGSALEDLLP